ncbi:uncharacterized protein LOC143277804 [Babylonia areolata]|uniref:uncharacterized protein LOC143277804 n=1 Tax=Babylonia areolata TaxID=304850 RepID=UPI003FCFEAE1
MAPLHAHATLIRLAIGLSLLRSTNGHGRLLEPPGRSSMWRVGFNTPKNYNDNALFCGGFSNQYERQGGRCGVCGDPYQGPRENEAGGKYATGTITRKFVQGQAILVTVEVTANHLGWFEFKLCPNNNPLKAATPECLNRHVLQLDDGSGSKLYIGTKVGKVDVKVRLPDDVTCSQCVLQWRWHTGNSYGADPRNGQWCLGCGNQEEFYGCSDVEIVPANRPAVNPGGIPGHAPSSSHQLGSGLSPLHQIHPPGNGLQPLAVGVAQGPLSFIPPGNVKGQGIAGTPARGPIPGSSVPVQGGYGLVQGGSGSVQGSYRPVQGNYGPVQGSYRPVQGSYGLIGNAIIGRAGSGLRQARSAVLGQDGSAVAHEGLTD